MSDALNPERIKSQSDFKKSPQGLYKRWNAELLAADKRVKKWHKQGRKIQSRYQDRRGLDSDRSFSPSTDSHAFRVNLFHSNVKTLREMIYGNPPKTDVSRNYADPEDDQARVASSILSRILNTTVESSGDDTKSVLGYCLEDRLLPGFGIARVRYEFDSEKEEVPPVEINGEVIAEGFIQENILDERAPIEYVHWDDVRWGWARTWSEVPWIAFRTYPNKDQVTKRFGKEVAKEIQYKNKNTKAIDEGQFSSEEVTDAWDRAEVWEIWEKRTKKVYWYCKGYEKILDEKPDPLKLSGFWPCPEPMLANCTTSLLLPQPDFAIAQDLYNQIDELETRIAIITKAVKVVGVYDSSEAGIKRMLQEGVENDLIPVENWAAFAEGGQLDGKVAWMPIQEVAQVLSELVGQRSDAMALLYEVTGMAEIMRGANGPDRETAEAASGKRQFASVRVQGLSEDFARFASDLMALRAEIISKHFEAKTILKQSNIMMSYDRDIAPKAVELIKNWEGALWRIKISPESLAMLDYQALKKDRIEFIGALAQFLQSAMPLAEMDQNTVPFLLQVLKWTMSGFKGSNEIEGVLDKALDQMMKAGPQEEKKEPSPEQLKMQAQQMKHKNDMQLQQIKHRHAMQEEQQKFQSTVQELKEELRKELQVIQAEMIAAIQEERAQSEAAMVQDDHETKNALKLKRVDNEQKRSREGESA